MFKPVFNYTNKIVKNLTAIAESRTIIINSPLAPKWEISLRKDAIIRSAHSSTAIENANRYKKKFALMVIDIDNFKYVNDTFGHTAGDDVLVAFSSKIYQTIRKIDTMARMGGDEFFMLISEIKEELDSIIIAEKLIRSFNNLI